MWLSLSLGTSSPSQSRAFSENQVVAGARVNVATNAVADTKRDYFCETVGGIDAPDLGHRSRREADVAGRAKRNVNPAFLVEHQIFPAMRRIGWHVIVDNLRLRQLFWVGFGIIVLIDLIDIRDVEGAIPVSDAGQHLHALRNGFDGPFPSVIFHRVDVGGQE